jgi:large subunit ribosomal protein L14e
VVTEPVANSKIDRKVVNLKWVALTSYRVPVLRGAHLKSVKAAFEKAEVAKKFAASSWGKRIQQRTTRSNLNDFQRFQVTIKKMAVRFV